MMETRKKPFATRFLSTVPAIALCMQLPLAARANDTIALRNETPSIDFTPVASATDTNTEETALQGGVKKNELTGDTQDNNLQTEQSKNDTTPTTNTPFQLAVQKLSSGAEMTSDDYRNLGIGWLGMDSIATVFHTTPTVNKVWKDSPAYYAGVQVGDLVVNNPDDTSHRKPDPTIPMWQVTFGKAGAKDDITFSRDGHLFTKTLVRENIEDIKDKKARKMWEKMAQKLGNPTHGTFDIEKP
jgi:C-terminal processing protease CtpA/Prc